MGRKIGYCIICMDDGVPVSVNGWCDVCRMSQRMEKQSSNSNQSNSSKRLSYIHYTPWYETGWLWFWLIVFPIVGLYGLYKRYPNFLWYFFGLAIIIRLFQLLFEWIKSFF